MMNRRKAEEEGEEENANPANSDNLGLHAHFHLKAASEGWFNIRFI